MNAATPPVLDVDALLEPIPGDDPSGASLAYEPAYDQIREARRSEDDSLDRGDWRPKEKAKVADWDRVVALGAECLRERTKDLQIAAWMAEALTNLHGFAGLRDGLRLLHGLQSRFWDSYYPKIDDGDLESRHGPFLFLNDPVKGLPFLVRGLPLTGYPAEESYSLFQYKESRETDNAIKKSPDKEKAILAQGRLTSKQFDDAVAATPKAFYARLVADLRGCVEAFQAFDRDTDERFGRDAPSLMRIGDALGECLQLLEPILTAKRQADPDPPEDEPESEADAGLAAPDGDGEAAPPGVVPEADGGGHLSRIAGPRPAALDSGRALIDFREKAQALAEVGSRLAENRKRYAELLAELKKLDDEYEDLSRAVSRDRECQQLLSRLLQLQGGAAAPA